MSSALLAKAAAIVAFTPAADYTAKKGYLVDLAGSVATISTSATVPAKGVILEENKTAAGYASETVTVGVLGGYQGVSLVKTSGAIAKGAKVIQAADGTVVTDSGAGARVAVGIALEDAVAGDLIQVSLFTPQTLA